MLRFDLLISSVLACIQEKIMCSFYTYEEAEVTVLLEENVT